MIHGIDITLRDKITVTSQKHKLLRFIIIIFFEFKYFLLCGIQRTVNIVFHFRTVNNVNDDRQNVSKSYRIAQAGVNRETLQICTSFRNRLQNFTTARVSLSSPINYIIVNTTPPNRNTNQYNFSFYRLKTVESRQ